MRTKLLLMFGATVLCLVVGYSLSNRDTDVRDGQAGNGASGGGGQSSMDIGDSIPPGRSSIRQHGPTPHDSTVAGVELVGKLLSRELSWEATMAALARLKQLMPASSPYVDKGYDTLVLGKIMQSGDFSLKEKAEILGKFGYELMEDREPNVSSWPAVLGWVISNVCGDDVQKRREFAEAMVPSKFKARAFVGIWLMSCQSVVDYRAMLANRRIMSHEIEGDDQIDANGILRDVGKRLYKSEGASLEELIQTVNESDLHQDEKESLIWNISKM